MDYTNLMMYYKMIKVGVNGSQFISNIYFMLLYSSIS